jgi:hypothetical protein
MIVTVAIASVVVVVASCWLVFGQPWRAWRERRLLKAEAARGIAGLETMLAERAARAGTRPGYGGDKGATGENAPNSQG